MIPALAVLPSERNGLEDAEMARANTELADRVDELKGQIEKLVDVVEDTRDKVTTMSTELQVGQHADPLPTRVRVLEHGLVDVKEELKEAKLQRWQVWLAVVAGMMSLLVQAAVALFSYTRHP